MQITGFRDRIQEFTEKNTALLGVTFSAAEDLKAWGDDVGYGGDLLSDSERSLAMAYGAAESRHQERPSRISYQFALIRTHGPIFGFRWR